ncbi:hypothetical protein GH714_030923 [Hevea brasiliensis]|uniref:Nucleoside phosphorylase domain-containing protein n=1 Tax=Hevea brasiliensis TaxID=3981 RepID=A0A6A6NDS1_HEVBR|nr:hypothetical protein GH714_030923 [Hevea brasiliensis]
MAPNGEGSDASGEAMLLNDLFPISSLSSVSKRGALVRYYGIYKDIHINFVWPGKDSNLGVDSIGTVSASVVTYAAIQALQPDLIINAGTAGGFKAKGASIGDVYLVSDVAFHDRRIPIPVSFDLYGVGLWQAYSTPNLLKDLNLKGAAVAYVADLLKVPAIFVKAVTDIVDGDKPTAEEFLQNLAAVTAALDRGITQVVAVINGKSFAEL